MKKVIVVSDFDGTITKKDSLVAVLDKFASPKWRNIARLITKGRLGTRIGLRREFALCRVSKAEFVTFITKNISIDPTFKNFLGFCHKKRFRFLVVSGGFRLNIETLFKKYGLKGIPYYANSITFKGNIVKLIFPYSHKSCKTCSLCKAPYIREFKKKGYFTIYIGDSVTDRCPARVADLVFAKHDLAVYCKAKGIAYVPFDTFGQIETYLKSASTSFLS
jgi:2-hydroxy-3-keto-5-methylthiopentenyl-1-phosphate phosphatase